MRKTSKIILVTIVATSILLGLGYAAIQNITLNVTGSAAAAVSQENFDVRFTRVIDVSDNTCVTANIESDQKANIVVSGLTAKGQFVTATYEIKNYSSDLSADLKIVTTNSNADYFTISSRLVDKSITAGNTTTVVVTVELTKTPIDGTVTSNISVGLEAMPVQPGEEGTSEGINDFSQTPSLTNEYGFYFGEGYSFQGEEEKCTVVFYEDGNGAFLIDDVLYRAIPENSFAYDTLAVDIDGKGEYLNFSADGRKLYSDNAVGETAILDEEFGNKYKALYPEKNEYGFYYGRLYSAWIGEFIASIVFYEDNTIAIYKDGNLFASFTENVVYSDNAIEFDGGIINVYFDGLIINFGGEILCLDISYFDAYNAIKKEKNEYGFYYDYAYSFNNDLTTISLTFDKNKVIRMYLNGVLCEYLDENVEYYKNRVVSDGLEIIFSDNGQCMTFNNMTFSLDIPYIKKLNEIKDEKNEYGFYFDKPYSVLMNDNICTVKFYEDGSAKIYTNGEFEEELDAGTYRYSQKAIIEDDEGIIFEVTNDGRVIGINDVYFVIDLYFEYRNSLLE